MTKDEALQMCLEYIETNAHERKYVRHAIKQALADHTEDNFEKVAPVAHIVGEIDHAGKVWTPAQPAPVQEPVVLKKGECWPEAVMQQWDYFRKLIADGDRSSFPRDWFESLADMRLVDDPSAAPVQEPVAWRWFQAPVKTAWGHEMVVSALAIDKDHTVSIYCERDQTAKVEAMLTPPAAQRQWVGLTDEEIIQCTPNWIGTLEDVARAVEAKLKEKNT